MLAKNVRPLPCIRLRTNCAASLLGFPSQRSIVNNKAARFAVLARVGTRSCYLFLQGVKDAYAIEREEVRC